MKYYEETLFNAVADWVEQGGTEEEIHNQLEDLKRVASQMIDEID